MRKLVLFCLACTISVTLWQGRSLAQYHFSDGRDWKQVDSYGFSAADTFKIKLMLLKSVYEVTLFSGKPLIQEDAPPDKFLSVYNKDFSEYPKIIDEFYADPDNLTMPLFFALKIADLTKRGVSAADREAYKQNVVSLLRQNGLLENKL
jgi:hypothetical protein